MPRVKLLLIIALSAGWAFSASAQTNKFWQEPAAPTVMQNDLFVFARGSAQGARASSVLCASLPNTCATYSASLAGILNGLSTSPATTPQVGDFMALSRAGTTYVAPLSATASFPIGTTANTIAAGNDTRLVGALQNAQDLADLCNVILARQNLGLGTAAVLAAGGAGGVAVLDGNLALNAPLGLTTPNPAAITALTFPQQSSSPAAPSGTGGVLYGLSGSGGTILTYRTANQIISFPGGNSGDYSRAWWQTPQGVYRHATTGNDPSLVQIQSNMTVPGTTAGFGVASLNLSSLLGTTAGSGSTLAITPVSAPLNTAFGLVNTVGIYALDGAGFHSADATQLNRYLANPSGATVFGRTTVLQSNTGLPSLGDGPMNSEEIDLIANAADTIVNGGRRILALDYKNALTVGGAYISAVGVGGSGYVTATPPPVTMTDTGGGTGWAGNAVVVGGAVVAVVTRTAGTGYVTPVVAIAAPTSGTTATATAAVALPVQVAYGLTIGPSTATLGSGASMGTGIGMTGPVTTAGVDLSPVTYGTGAAALRLGVTPSGSPAGHVLAMTDGTGTATIGAVGSGGNDSIVLTPAGTGSVILAGTVNGAGVGNTAGTVAPGCSAVFGGPCQSPAQRAAYAINLKDQILSTDTDATAGFNRAVASGLALSTSFEIDIPCGTYTISGTVSISTTGNQGVFLRGAGASCVTITQTADADAFPVTLNNYGGVFGTGAFRASGIKFVMAAAGSTTRNALSVSTTAVTGTFGVPVVEDDLTFVSSSTTSYWGTEIALSQIPNVAYLSRINGFYPGQFTGGTHISVVGNSTSYTTSVSIRDSFLGGGLYGVNLGNYLQGVLIDNLQTVKTRYALYSAPNAGVNEEFQVSHSYLDGLTYLVPAVPGTLSAVEIDHTYFDNGQFLSNNDVHVSIGNVNILALDTNTFNGPGASGASGVTGLSIVGTTITPASVHDQKIAGYGNGGTGLSVNVATYPISFNGTALSGNTTNVTDTSSVTNQWPNTTIGATQYSFGGPQNGLSITGISQIIQWFAQGPDALIRHVFYAKGLPGNDYLFRDGSNHTIFQIQDSNSTSVDNGLNVVGAAAGASAAITSIGNATNIMLGTAGSLATSTTVGLPQIPYMAGAPTGAPATTGGATLVYNTTSHNLNIYDPVASSWYHVALTVGAN